MEMLQEKGSQVEAIEITLARLLRVGSLLAAGLIGVGIVLMLVGVALGSTLALAGLIVLVSTPVLRVAVAMVVFLREKDYLFAFFCFMVILALGVGMVIGNLE